MTLERTNQDGIFDPGEKVLWRGRSDTSVRFQPPNIKQVLIGLLVIVLGVVALVKSYRDGSTDMLGGILFVPIGIWIAFGWVFRLLNAKDPTSYYVTGSRACRDDVSMLGKSRISCVEFNARTEIEFKDGDPPGVLISNIHGAALAFEDMYNAHHVVAELRKIQKELP